jgi:hypothetical protein
VRGLLAVVLLTAVVAVVGGLGMPVAAAADEPGLLRVAHLSPDTPPVDVALAPLPDDGGPLVDPGRDVATALAYGGVGEFAQLPSGRYAVSVRASGSGPGAPPALSAHVDVPPGGGVTVALTGSFAGLALHGLPDDLSPAPPGSARVRVVAAAAEAETIDVGLAGGPALATGLPFGHAAEPVVLQAGSATLRVDDGSGPVDLPTSFAAGSVATVLVLDGPDGGLTLRVVVDAAAPAVVPTGGVEAGGGPAPSSWGPAAAAALALTAVRRRRRLALLVTGAVVAGLAPAALPSPAAAGDTTPVVLAAQGSRTQPDPTRLQVPSAGVDAVVSGVGLDSAGALVPPADPALAGWYVGGPAPGGTGPAVLAGHVDWAGEPGVFARLDDVAIGDAVLVGRADGTTLRYVVTDVARHPKSAFPTAEVYRPTPGTELRLITCGGAFDRADGRYLDNVVVSARAA